ncbi:MAG: ATP synthase F0 subunit B [Lachnospiraceae bacterium]|nr:ATP synthase F0 subunit B [Lachnospiraceae bacterium]
MLKIDQYFVIGAIDIVKIDWNLLFTVINLVILFIAMKLFLFKPVRKILEKRQEEADTASRAADEREAEASRSKAEYEKAIAKTESERAQILSDARKQADEEYAKMLADARAEAEIIKKNANTEGEKRKQRIISEAGKEIGDMITAATAKIMGDADETDLYDAFLTTMEEKK